MGSGLQSVKKYDSTLFKFHTFSEQQKDSETDEAIMAMEIVEKSNNILLEPACIFDVLKLYQMPDIFSFYLLSYRVIEGKLQGGGKVRLRQYAHTGLINIIPNGR